MRAPWRAVAAGVGISAVLATGCGMSESDYVRITAGPTPDVADALVVDDPVTGNPEGTGAFLITTVATQPLNQFAAVRCQFDTACTLIDRPDTEFMSDVAAQMDRSLRNADAAAEQLGGDLARWPAAPGNGRVPGIGGPSAGLALALHLLQQRVPGDLSAGMAVAATGTVSARGSVGEVGGVAYKARGATDAGADVFFVPVAEAGQAKGTAGPRLEVVAVDSVHDAVAWLCEHGATSDLCGKSSRTDR